MSIVRITQFLGAYGVGGSASDKRHRRIEFAAWHGQLNSQGPQKKSWAVENLRAGTSDDWTRMNR
jgi:hypothetical protein